MSSLIVTIHDVARGGSGVARIDSGEIVFVPFTAPGDVASVRIVEKKKTYSQGELIEIIEPSPQRVKPLCPVFGKCGGCSWQHLPYETQFQIKKSGVLHALKRAGVDATMLPVDELPAASPFFYRNRIQLRGNPQDGSIGFHERDSSRLIPISDCKIARKEINEALPSLRVEGAKLDREFKVEIEVTEKGEVRSAWNRKHAAFGFRQVNDEQNLALQNWVQEHIDSGDILLDLYGGSGNLSKNLVDRFRRIECVDVGTPKQKPAEFPDHFEFHRSGVAEWMERTKGDPERITQVVLDPPREGLGADFARIETNLRKKFNPETIVLVGCDPDAFARDVYRFTQRGFSLVKLGVLDLFPQTPHVESLAVLKRSTLR